MRCGFYIWNISRNSSFDLYGKYLWTRQQGDTVTLSTGESLDFQSVNSHRLRLGGRLTCGTNRSLKPYLGAAWEHEFSGAARATTNGYAIGVPTLRGDTGIAELGLAWKPMAYHGLFADFGVQGYAGKREGATASLYIGKTF